MVFFSRVAGARWFSKVVPLNDRKIFLPSAHAQVNKWAAMRSNEKGWKRGQQQRPALKEKSRQRGRRRVQGKGLRTTRGR